MKKLVLISTFCDNEEKLGLLETNISKLKNLGLDVFVISPLKIDVSCDFLFITKENPILTHGNKQISWWSVEPFEDKKIKLIRHVEDYGWASLYQIKKIMEFASTMNYDLFYMMIYDINITEELEKVFLSEEKNVSFPRTDFFTKSKIYPFSFHLSIFDKNKLIEMSKKIDFDDYCGNDGFAEDFIEKWCKELEIPNSNIIVEDMIDTSPKISYWDYSKSPFYKLFISKDERTPFSVYVYNCEKILDVDINGNKYEITKQSELITTELDLIVSSLTIKCDDEIIDYLDVYDSILNNQLQTFYE